MCVFDRLHRSCCLPHLVHSILLHSKFPSIAMRGFGHVLQLLLLQLGMLRRNSLTQTVYTTPKTNTVRTQFVDFPQCIYSQKKEKKLKLASLLYVLLMA